MKLVRSEGFSPFLQGMEPSLQTLHYLHRLTYTLYQFKLQIICGRIYTAMSELKKQLGKMSRQEQEQLLNLETLPGHLAQSKQGEKLYQLLTDFDFIEAKLELWGVQPLIEDYDLARTYDMLLSPEQTEILKLIQGAIRKSASVLDKDKTQLVEQLLGRLLDFEMPVIQELMEQGRQSKDSVWLRPLRGNLERPGEGCLQTLIGHTREVTAVAIAPDGLTAISASDEAEIAVLPSGAIATALTEPV